MISAKQEDLPDWSRDTFVGFLSGDSDQDQRNVRILLETVSLGNSVVAFDEFLVSVVEKTLLITGADRCLLLLREGKSLVARVALNSRLEEFHAADDYSKSIPETVARTGEAVRVSRGDGLDTKLSKSMLEHDLLTVMCAPMRSRDKVNGVLYVDSHNLLKDFSDSDWRLFKALSCLLAASIEHAMLLKSKQDLVVAGEIQRRLLPAEGLRLPYTEVFGRSDPHDETGGDYFDYFPLGEGHVGFAIGDVSGHGVAAALLMATGRALLRAHVAVEWDPGKVMEYVNRALVRDTSHGAFMTMLYGHLNQHTGEIYYVRAGHPTPILYSAREDDFRELTGPGPLLGVDPDFTYETTGPVRTEPGDVLVLYTDGITEAPRTGSRRGAEDHFGLERLLDTLRRHRTRGARGIVRGVFSAVERYGGPAGSSDDRTMAVLRVLGRKPSE